MIQNATSARPSIAAKATALDAPTVAATAPARSPSVAMGYGHYVIERRPDGTPWVLGRGGMGTTFKATDTNLHCPVALKIISPNCFDGEHSEHRFLREARLAAQIRHPNVAAIHHLDCQDGEFFYAMEFVDGISAEAWVRRRGPMAVDLSLDIVMQVTRALTAADRLKVLHRDIKPGNIMILPDPANGTRVIAKLIDFGLARSVGGEASPTATTCGFTGTPQFASPEQAENLELDVRSDIYSLGSTFWYLLMGEAPFVGTPARIIAQLLTSEPPWDLVKHLPKRVVRLLRSMLAKDPADRPQTPVALHDQIIACREHLARRPARSTSAQAQPAASLSLYGLRSFAFAGVLGLVLIWLALSPRAHVQEKFPPPMSQAEVANSPSKNLASLAPQNTPGQPQGQTNALFQKPDSESTPAELKPVPELAPVTVDLQRFDQQPDAFSMGQETPDSASAAALNGNQRVSLTMAGLDTQEQPNSEDPAARTVDQRVSERKRGRQQRHSSSSPWQTLDKVRGSVEGLVRHLF